MRLATIDIGTNSTKLLIAKANADGTLTPLCEEVRLSRLGEGSQKDRVLKEPAMTRTLDALAEFHALLVPAPEVLQVVATMCTREAINKTQFLKQVKARFGWDVRVLSGDEEAALSYRGARTRWVNLPPPIAAIDIGGGSSEWIVETSEGTNAESLSLGGVRQTEMFVTADPPKPVDVEHMRQHVDGIFSKLPRHLRPLSGSSLIGIGGTVSSIEAMMRPQQPTEQFTYEELRTLLPQVAAQSTQVRIQNYPHLHPGRADVIFAGICILESAMRTFQIQTCLVSHRGLRYGVAAEIAIAFS